MVQVPPPFSARVEIKCGQLVLPEYVDESLSDDPLHITRYVECQPDRQFEIQVALDEGFVFQGSDAVVSCYIDGEYIEGALLNNERYARRVATIRGKDLGGASIAPLTFAKLRIDADQSLNAEPLNKHKAIGTIELILSHANRLARGSDRPLVPAPDNDIAISEKALKGQAISHHVSFGAIEHWNPPARYIVAALGQKITLTLLYRSRADLEAMLIVERPREASEANERDLDQMDSRAMREELNAAREELRQLRESSTVIKRERSDTKTEERPAKRLPIMIDLLDDDAPAKEVPLPDHLK